MVRGLGLVILLFSVINVHAKTAEEFASEFRSAPRLGFQEQGMVVQILNQAGVTNTQMFGNSLGLMCENFLNSKPLENQLSEGTQRVLSDLLKGISRKEAIAREMERSISVDEDHRVRYFELSPQLFMGASPALVKDDAMRLVWFTNQRPLLSMADPCLLRFTILEQDSAKGHGSTTIIAVFNRGNQKAYKEFVFNYRSENRSKLISDFEDSFRKQCAEMAKR